MVTENASYIKVKRVLWIILFANIAVAVLKISVGTIIESTSLTADGFHSMTDGASNVVGLIGIRLAHRPVDEDHPYGHGKFETLTGLFISAILFVISVKIITDAVDKIMHPMIPNITLESLVALIVTLGVNIFVCTYEYKAGKKLNSQILISDSLHTRSDVYVSIGVLVTLVSVKLGLPVILDPIVSLIVAVFIIRAGYEIFKSSRDILVDKVAIDENRIKEIILGFKEVRDTHSIRSRGSSSALYIDMHIMTEPNMSIEESHVLIHSIENIIRKEINNNVQVIAHLEPYENNGNNAD